MSYAPNPTGQRSRTGTAASGTASGRSQGRTRGSNGTPSQGNSTPRQSAAKTAPRGKPFDEPRNWKQLGTLAAGIAAGAMAGAGLALLFTSKTGPQRRAGLARRARHLGHDAEQRWEDLAFTMKEAARTARDRFRHRHAAESETAVDD